MVKLTRMNNQVVVINPDHIAWADASPDTVLFLVSGEKIMVRESFDELIERVVEYRRKIRANNPGGDVVTIETFNRRPTGFTTLRPSIRPGGHTPGSGGRNDR
jgi:flagellar protein FlbD